MTEQMELGPSLVDVLGRERPIKRTYPDGSFDCPFCASAAHAPATRCVNPWCPASSLAMSNPSCAETFRQKIAEQAAREAEAENRRKNAESRMEYIRQERQERETWIGEQYAEAERRGTCRRCLDPDPYRRVAKFVKHRKGCPKEATR